MTKIQIELDREEYLALACAAALGVSVVNREQDVIEAGLVVTEEALEELGQERWNALSERIGKIGQEMFPEEGSTHVIYNEDVVGGSRTVVERPADRTMGAGKTRKKPET